LKKALNREAAGAGGFIQDDRGGVRAALRGTLRAVWGVFASLRGAQSRSPASAAVVRGRWCVETGGFGPRPALIYSVFSFFPPLCLEIFQPQIKPRRQLLLSKRGEEGAVDGGQQPC